MALVGVSFSNQCARWVLFNKTTSDEVKADRFGSVSAQDWDEALRAIHQETGARDVAITVEPPDLVIQETQLGQLKNDGERHRAVRLRAEEFGFERRDDVRVRFDEEDRAYFGAIHRRVSDEIRKAAAAAKMRVVWIEHAAYAWVRFLDEPYAALIDASDDERIACVIVGDRRAELRVFPNDSSLFENLEDTLLEAERTGFARSTLATVALIDPHGIFQQHAQLGQSTLKPYWCSLAPSWTQWMAPLGVGFAAAGGEMPRDLLRVNFAEAEPRRWQDLYEPIVALLPQRDVTVVGMGAVLAALVIGAQWSQLQILTGKEKTYHDQAQILSARAAAIQQEAKVVSDEAASLANRYAAAESGPRTARALTSWMARFPNGATLTNVTYAPDTGLSVRGNLQSPQVLETAYRVVGHANAQVQQDGSVFNIQDANGPIASPSPSPAPGAPVAPGGNVPPVGGTAVSAQTQGAR